MIDKNNIYYKRIKNLSKKNIKNKITYRDDNSIKTTLELDKDKMSEDLFKYMQTYIKNK